MNLPIDKLEALYLHQEDFSQDALAYLFNRRYDKYDPTNERVEYGLNFEKVLGLRQFEKKVDYSKLLVYRNILTGRDAPLFAIVDYKLI